MFLHIDESIDTATIRNYTLIENICREIKPDISKKHVLRLIDKYSTKFYKTNVPFLYRKGSNKDETETSKK